MIPSFQWVGSSDPEVGSGKATFFAGEEYQISLDLPDFVIAHQMSEFISKVYNEGKTDGINVVRWAVDNATRTVVERHSDQCW